MKPIIGTKVRASEFDHQWVEDILYFEGPILSLLKGSTSQDFFYYWCDSNHTYNRWLAVDVERKDIELYKSRQRSLFEIVISKTSLHVLDLDKKLKPSRAWIVEPGKLPDEYIPPKSSLFDIDLAPTVIGDLLESPSSYDLKLDGEWFLDDLIQVPRLYSQLYSFTYTLQNLWKHSVRTNAQRIFSTYPWRGGFSTVHFFKSLDRVIPSLHEPQVKSIQYASPGEIRLELLSNVSVELRYILDSICKNKDALEEITKDIQSHLREQKLSKIPGNNPSIILTENTKTFLRSNFRLLSKNLGLSSYTKEIRNLATNDLVATKILLSIYRRAKKISAFKDKGMIEL